MWQSRTLLITDCNLGTAAHERISNIARNLTWFSWDFGDRDARDEIRRQIRLGRWDLGISFYSDLILTPAELDMIRLPLNVHPALPEIRGVGHDVVPLVERHSIVGATLHRMEPVLDSGEIYDIIEAPIDSQVTYQSLRAFNQSLCLNMLDRLCGILAVTQDLDGLEASLRARAAKVRHGWGRYYSRAMVRELRKTLP